MDGIRSLTMAVQDANLSADEIFTLNARPDDAASKLKAVGFTSKTIDDSIYKYNIIFRNEPNVVYGYLKVIALATFHAKNEARFKYPGLNSSRFYHNGKLVYLVW